jgi:hypothetical protein
VGNASGQHGQVREGYSPAAVGEIVHQPQRRSSQERAFQDDPYWPGAVGQGHGQASLEQIHLAPGIESVDRHEAYRGAIGT